MHRTHAHTSGPRGRPVPPWAWDRISHPALLAFDRGAQHGSDTLPGQSRMLLDMCVEACWGGLDLRVSSSEYGGRVGVYPRYVIHVKYGTYA